MRRLIVCMFVLTGMMAIRADGVRGQAYPSRPIRIVTTGSGGATDVAVRLMGAALSNVFGQPVIIDNRTGLLAAEIVSKAPPDGYTLYVGGDALWLAPLLQKVPYDPRDFAPISLMNRTPSVLLVHPTLPVASVSELIALAKAKPGALNYSSSLTGGSNHLSAELFKAMAGVNIVRVPYKSGGLALNALIGGEVQLTFATLGTAGPQLNSGRIKALAVTSTQPSPLFPGLPTVAATGLPGYEYATSQALFAPAATPHVIVNVLNKEAVQVLHRPEIKEKLFTVGLDVATTTPAQLAALMKAESLRMAKVIKDAGITVNQ